MTGFLLQPQPAAALETVDLITEAVGMPGNHPLFGRPAEDGLRELEISRGRSGDLALYSHEAADDIALVLAVRHQREAGYTLDPP